MPLSHVACVWQRSRLCVWSQQMLWPMTAKLLRSRVKSYTVHTLAYVVANDYSLITFCSQAVSRRNFCNISWKQFSYNHKTRNRRGFCFERLSGIPISGTLINYCKILLLLSNCLVISRRLFVRLSFIQLNGKLDG